jgi:hypothetical protein
MPRSVRREISAGHSGASSGMGLGAALLVKAEVPRVSGIGGAAYFRACMMMRRIEGASRV